MQNVFRRLQWVRSLCKFEFLLVTLMGFGGVINAASAATPANTLIQNTASLVYSISGTPGTIDSNTVSFRVDELIAFTLVANNPAGVFVQSPQTNAVLSYSLSNQGNGSEKFSLGISQSVADQFDPTSTQIFIDSNGNGIFEVGTDTLYTGPSSDPTLAMGDSLFIFVVSDIQGSLASADESEVSLTATSDTGAGVGGTAYNTLGDGGVDALMGMQGGTLTVLNKYVVSTAAAALSKSQSILDPQGGANPIQNAVITYTLTLTVTGTGNITNVQIGDAIPTGTTYVVDSLRLDASPLTDAADIDAGVFNGSSIVVSLGTVSAPTTRTVTFKVRID